MLTSNAQLSEQARLEVALSNTTPSSTTPRYVSMKAWERCTIIISALNASTVTGSAITVKQATDIANANSDEKAVAFTTALRNLDRGAADALSSFAVSSNTFTTGAVNSKEMQYVIEIQASDLDIDNGFDCIRLGTGNATAQTITAVYVLWGARYGKTATAMVDPSVN